MYKSYVRLKDEEKNKIKMAKIKYGRTCNYNTQVPSSSSEKEVSRKNINSIKCSRGCGIKRGKEYCAC